MSGLPTPPGRLDHGADAVRFNGRLLEVSQHLSELGLSSGDTLMATIVTPQIVASAGAVALCCAGQVVTWGEPQCGADSRMVRDELKDVRQIVASLSSFAAWWWFQICLFSTFTWHDRTY